MKSKKFIAIKDHRKEISYLKPIGMTVLTETMFVDGEQAYENIEAIYNEKIEQILEHAEELQGSKIIIEIFDSTTLKINGGRKGKAILDKKE